MLIAPSVVTNAELPSMAYQTPRGEVRVAWAVSAAVPLSLNVSLPPNTRATVMVPPGGDGHCARRGFRLTEGKTTVVWSASEDLIQTYGVKLVRYHDGGEHDGHVELRVGSGVYAFQVEYRQRATSLKSDGVNGSTHGGGGRHKLRGPRMPRTIGAGIPSFPVPPGGVEVAIYNHTLPPGRDYGVINHLWSVGEGRASEPELDGVQIYRFYVDGETTASVQFAMRQAAGIVFDPVITDKRDITPLPGGSPRSQSPKGMNSSAIVVSAPTPWGTEWFGKGSDMEGYYNNFVIPFGASIVLTVAMPEWHNKTTGVWTIVRGQEGGPPISIGGQALPATARLHTHHNDKLFVVDMAFTPLINITRKAGVVWGTTLGIEMGPNPHVNPLGFLEGCFHLITPLQQQYGVGSGFPGVVLSTGMVDFYDSSYYFHAGIFQNPVSGLCVDAPN